MSKQLQQRKMRLMWFIAGNSNRLAVSWLVSRELASDFILSNKKRLYQKAFFYEMGSLFIWLKLSGCYGLSVGGILRLHARYAPLWSAQIGAVTAA